MGIIYQIVTKGETKNVTKMAETGRTHSRSL
jgi:hypothetical protein